MNTLARMSSHRSFTTNSTPTTPTPTPTTTPTTPPTTTPTPHRRQQYMTVHVEPTLLSKSTFHEELLF
eukprot:m.262054 g.262054  ORF g.262054 m.262054 type:complete len:68 (-) comp44202_c0_seq1:73-276(-)